MCKFWEFQQEAQLPQRNSASAAHVYLGWLTDHAMHKTLRNRRGCNIFLTFKRSDSKIAGRKRILSWNSHSKSFCNQLPADKGQHIIIYKGRSVNKLQNGAIPSVLKIGKILNIRFVENLILNIYSTLLDDDVIIVTSSDNRTQSSVYYFLRLVQYLSHRCVINELVGQAARL